MIKYQKKNKQMCVQVYAYHPDRPDEIIEGWRSHPAESNLLARKYYLIECISTGTWRNFKSQSQRDWLARARSNGWVVGVRLGAYTEGVTVIPGQGAV